MLLAPWQTFPLGGQETDALTPHTLSSPTPYTPSSTLRSCHAFRILLDYVKTSDGNGDSNETRILRSWSKVNMLLAEIKHKKV